MQWSTEVVSALSSDTEPAILVVFNDHKYMFNTSENTMRSFLQSGRLWRRTKCLFFTQSRVEKIGGLPGLIMSFADATINNLQLIGPPGLNHLLASMRTYTYRDSIALKTSETPWTTTTDPKPCFTDENVTVYAVPAIPSLDASLSPSATEPTDGATMQCDDRLAETAVKRKRDLSADAPRKRMNVGDEAFAGSQATNEGTATYEDEADTHRKTMIQHMFPGTNIPSQEEVAQSNRAPVADQPILSSVDVENMSRTRPESFWKQLPKFTNPFPKAPPTMCYLVVGPRYRGKFDAAKAKALGIPNGRVRATLAGGQPITIEVEVNGEKAMRTIQPEDVLGKGDPPAAILILDVPTPAHVPSLLSAFQSSDFYRKIWSEDSSSLSAKEEPKFILRTIYQTCGKGVLDDEMYKTFLRGFGPETNHIIASRELCPDPITFTSVSENQLRLSSIDDKIFPLPKYSLTPKRDLSSVPGLPVKIQIMSSTLQNVMRPWSAPAPDPAIVAADRFHPLVNGTEVLKISPALQRYTTYAHASIAEVIARREIKPVEGADVGIITLGTGGSLPSKYRNVLSTLVKIPGWGNILLDAGEGTWGQLARAHGLDGPDNAWKTLRDLKCIFISHIHGDHHMGLSQVLAKRRELDPPPSEPLYVVSLRSVHLYLREVQDVQDIGIDDPSGNGVIPVLSESIHFNHLGRYLTTGLWKIGGDEPWLGYNKSQESARRMCDALGLEYFKTADVDHRCKCYGASFRHKDGWSITFSGDTAPSSSLRKLGMNSTLLIHEATMSQDELALARKKAHSTVGQAVAEGIAMNAKNILLTHFSARYAKVPPDLVGRRGLPPMTLLSFNRERQIVPAFDHLNLTIGEMWKIQFYLRPMVQAIEHVENYMGSPSPEPEPSPRRRLSTGWHRSPSPSPWSGVQKQRG